MEKKKRTFYNVLTFPEKLNVFWIYVFIVLLTVVDTLIILFVVPKVDYSYIPSYEERKEYDWMNPYIRAITNYYEDDNNEIYSSMTATFCYFGVDVNHKATKTIGTFTIIDDDNEIYYVGDLEKSTTTSYSTTSTPLSRLSKTISGIKTIYGKVEYNKIMSGEQQGSDVIMFKEDFLQISSSGINKLDYSSENDIANVFEKFLVSTETENNKTKITNKIDLAINVDLKYHFDYQLFGVDKNDKIYDLIGIYNFSNNYSRYINLDTRVPQRIEFSYYIAMFKITINNEEKIIYIRKEA